MSIAAGLFGAWFVTLVAEKGQPIINARTDWDHLWVASRMLFNGVDPYGAIGPHPEATFQLTAHLVYPLSTVVAITPLAFMPLAVARALLFGASIALLGWALSAERLWRWLIAHRRAARADDGSGTVGRAHHRRLPWAGGLLALKLQNTVVWLAATLSRRMLVEVVAVSAVLGLVTLAVQPDWPLRWRAPVATQWSMGPLLVRLLLAIALVLLVPGPYELMPLVLVAHTQFELLVLWWGGVLTQVGQRVALHYLGDWPQSIGPLRDAVILGLCLPALVTILRRPNEGEVPAWLKRIAARASLAFHRRRA